MLEKHYLLKQVRRESLLEVRMHVANNWCKQALAASDRFNDFYRYWEKMLSPMTTVLIKMILPVTSRFKDATGSRT